MKAFGKACKRTLKTRQDFGIIMFLTIAVLWPGLYKKSGLGATVESGEQVRVGLGDR